MSKFDLVVFRVRVLGKVMVCWDGMMEWCELEEDQLLTGTFS